jgi:hypothetical protein
MKDMWAFLNVEPVVTKPLAELNVSSVSERPGIYILLAGNGTVYRYPRGNSPIFYIGLGNSLRNRVTTRKRRVQRLLRREKKVGDTNLKTEWPRYEYAAHHNAMVAAFPVRLLGGQTIRDVESEAIGLFAACFGSPPVANAAASRKTLQRRPAVPLGAFDGSSWIEESEA